MKRTAILLLVLTLCLSLCGCAGQDPDPLKDGVLTWKELTMELPEGYVRLNTREYEGMFTFTYGSRDNLVVGYREPKELILGQYPDMTRESYAQMVIDSSGMDTELQVIDGITCFFFTDIDLEEAKEYAYIAAVYDCEDSFWLLQTCCQTKNFEAEKDGFWEILKSVKLEIPESDN